MIKDKNNVVVEIGDIVKIENSPIKSDNAVYVVGQDGTSKGYSGADLTMYKVAKHKGGYSLSKSSYNICFYPLHNYSSKYHYTRQEMDAATIEVLLKANSNAFNLVKSDDKYEAEETEQTYFRAVVKIGEEEIEDASYPASEPEKMCAFFSNITLKQGETIEICKQDYAWGYYNRNIEYKLESTKPVEEVTETETTAKQTETIEANNLHYNITEDIDTRDNSKIFVVKVVEKLDRDEYLTVSNNMKSIGGYYSKFKRGFIFKKDPTDLLNSDIKQEETSTKAQDTAETIEDYSTEIIEELQLNPSEYATNSEYINRLTAKINHLNITNNVIDCLEYEGLKQAVKTILTNRKEQPTKTETTTPEAKKPEVKPIDFEIEQKDKIWLVKIKDSLPKEKFAEVKRNFATLKGFYSSNNNSFIFKYDPTEKLKTSA